MTPPVNNSSEQTQVGIEMGFALKLVLLQQSGSIKRPGVPA